tara:strand:- start:240 stop:971 length:732 start_codon:yes stop_codon:yes gene_type:complete
MLKFKLDEKEYEIPEIMTIENYSKIFKIKDLFSDDYFAAKLVSIVTGAPVEDLLDGDYEEVSYIAAYIMELLPKTKPEFKDRFELDGISYGFIPKWQDMTYAEFVDMDTIATRKQDEMLNMLHILLAVMYRPITNERTEHDFDIEKYDVKKMTKRAELFKSNLDVRYVLGAQTFFTNFGRRYSVYSQASLIPKLSIWQKMKLTWTMRKIIWAALFKKPLDGMSSQTELLEMILRSTNTSTKKR